MRPRILFVDDHEDSRELLARLLPACGFDVVTADSVHEAHRLARSEEFDLFLLDYWFADGTGKELCELIREFDPDTPILFFSGTHPKEQQEALSCGAQGFVLKPDFDALWGEIHRVLKRAA